MNEWINANEKASDIYYKWMKANDTYDEWMKASDIYDEWMLLVIFIMNEWMNES